MAKILGQFGRLLGICVKAPGGKMQLALLAVIIALDLGSVYVSVRLVQWTGDFYSAIQKLEGPEIVRQVGIFAIIVALNSVRGLTAGYLRKMLEIKWRRSLTDHALTMWTSGKAYWHMANFPSEPIDNPDQRIADDCRIFINKMLSELLDLISRIVGLFSYVVLLWGLSNFALSLDFIGLDVQIPRYMVWAAFLYVALSTIITHLLGKPLKSLLAEQQRREADFRFSMARWRTAFDEVALSGGESVERSNFNTRFERVAQNWQKLMRQELILGTFTFPYQHTVLRIPLFVALPGYLAGHVAFGGLMQLGMAFSNVVTTLSWLIFSYRDLAELVATASRLDHFLAAAHVAANDSRKSLQLVSSDKQLRLEHVDLFKPDGQELLAVRDMTITQGETICLRGASGIGKTTLTKAIAGLWRHGSGVIEKPSERLMILPQKPYLPEGSLMAAAAYPSDLASFERGDVETALHEAGLGHRLQSKDGNTVAGEKLAGLSGGELQRLAIARLLLHRPQWAILDEATSALDVESETRLLHLIRNRLKDTALVIIAHRLPQGMDGMRMIDLQQQKSKIAIPA